jgi:hypothetical protein
MQGGQPFQLKAVAYSPTPIGLNPSTGATGATTDIRFIQRDGSLLRSAGIEALRIYGTLVIDGAGNASFGTTNSWVQAAAAEEQWVIAGSFIEPTTNFADTNRRNDIINAHVNMVNTFGSEPNILMWVIGNEVNLTTGQLNDYYTLVDEVAVAMKAAQGGGAGPGFGPYICVVDGNGGLGILGGASLAPNVDIWAANVFEGTNFNPIISNIQNNINKPFWIAEYGIDSWHYDAGAGSPPGFIDETTQADFAQTLWSEVNKNNSLVFGADLGFWTDEWWKSVIGGDPATSSIQDYGGNFFGRGTDNHITEEWLGIVGISSAGGGNPDNIVVKEAYDRIKAVLVGGLDGPADFRADFNFGSTDNNGGLSNNYGGYNFGFYGGTEFQDDSLLPIIQTSLGFSGSANDNALRADATLSSQSTFTFFGIVVTLYPTTNYGYNLSRYDTLSFDARLGSSPGAHTDWVVRLEDNDSSSGPEFNNIDAPLSPAPTTTYQSYSYPLSTFTSGAGQQVDISQLTQIVFGGITPGNPQPANYEVDLIIDNIRITGPADINPVPPSLDFSEGTGFEVDTSLGEFPSEQSVCVFNLGASPLTISNLVFSGAFASDYSLVSPPTTPFVVAPFGNVTLTIRFDPNASPQRAGNTAQLEITSDSPGETLISIPLSGDAVPVTSSMFLVD